MDFKPLEKFLHRVPAVNGPVGEGSEQSGMWWVKFSIDIEHELAWRVVQEFGHVLNSVSLDERFANCIQASFAATLPKWRSSRLSILGHGVLQLRFRPGRVRGMARRSLTKTS